MRKDHIVSHKNLISDFRPNEPNMTQPTPVKYSWSSVSHPLIHIFYYSSLESGRMAMPEEYALESLRSLTIAVITPLPASTSTLALSQSGHPSQPSLVEAEATFQDDGLGTGVSSGSSASDVSLRQGRIEFTLPPVDRGYGAWSFVSIRFLVFLK
jgi:hypothetical protein